MLKYILPSLFFVCSLIACTDYPEADFYEVNGIVSINARSLEVPDGWSNQRFATSISIISSPDTLGVGSRLSFSFFIRRPGTYHLWLLSARQTYSEAEEAIPFRVMDAQNFLLDNRRLKIASTDQLRWNNKEFSTHEPVTISFNEPGHYRISFESQGLGGYVIDKLHLAFDNIRRPAGFGFPETRDFRSDPVLAKRDHIYVIPPAWAFGVVAGQRVKFDNNDTEADNFSQLDIAADAVWYVPQTGGENWFTSLSQANRDNNLLDVLAAQKNSGVKTGIYLHGFSADEAEVFPTDDLVDATENLLDHGLSFIKTGNGTGFEQSKQLFELFTRHGTKQHQRGYLLTGVDRAYNSGSKQYPAMYAAQVVPEWSSDGFTPDTQFKPLGLHEQVQVMADPLLSEYEISFLSAGIPFGELSDELLIRWVQFAAFNSLMHFDLTRLDSGFDIAEQYSDETLEIVRQYIDLRRELFPYLYSLAHLVRPTGVKPVRGDGEHSTQFRLGNHVIVAPVTRQGEREKEVYLPEGTWFCYWEGTRFDGDNTIVADAPLNRIPVFVESGAILPRRTVTAPILSGSNSKLTIDVYAGSLGTFRLYEDDGVSYKYQRGEFSTTAYRFFQHHEYATFTIGRRVNGYEGQEEMKHHTLNFHFLDEPAAVFANGDSVPQGRATNSWSYSAETNVLTIEWEQPYNRKTDFEIRF